MKLGQQGLEHKTLACLTTFQSAMLIGLNVISSSCNLYFKADWLKIPSLSKLSLPFYACVFTSAENVSLLPGLHVQGSAWQQSLMKVLSLKEREVIKTAEKILVQL